MPDRTCCIGPDLYPVVFRLKLFQIETITLIIENKVFYPQGGCGGQKNSPSGTHAILVTSPHSPDGGGGGGCSGKVQCVHFEIPAEFFCRLYSFVIVRGVSSNTIKTGLNCWQFCLLLKSRSFPFS